MRSKICIAKVFFSITFFFLSLVSLNYSHHSSLKELENTVESKVSFYFKLKLFLLKSKIDLLSKAIHSMDSVEEARDNVSQLNEFNERFISKKKAILKSLDELQQQMQHFQETDLKSFNDTFFKHLENQQKSLDIVKNEIDKHFNDKDGALAAAKNRLNSGLSYLLKQNFDKFDEKMEHVLVMLNELDTTHSKNLNSMLGLYDEFHHFSSDLNAKMSTSAAVIEKLGNQSLSEFPDILSKQLVSEKTKLSNFINKIVYHYNDVEMTLNSTISKLYSEGYAAVNMKEICCSDSTKIIRDLILARLELSQDVKNILPIFIFTKDNTILKDENLNYHIIPSKKMIDDILLYTLDFPNLQYAVVSIDGVSVDVFTLPELNGTTIIPDKDHLQFKHFKLYGESITSTLNQYSRKDFSVGSKKILFVYFGTPFSNFTAPKNNFKLTSLKLKAATILKNVDSPNVQTFMMFKHIKNELNFWSNINSLLSNNDGLASASYLSNLDTQLIIAQKHFDIPVLPFSSFFATTNLLMVLEIDFLDNEQGKKFYTSSSFLIAHGINELAKNVSKPGGSYLTISTKVKLHEKPLNLLNQYYGRSNLKLTDIEGVKYLIKESKNLLFSTNNMQDLINNVKNVVEKHIHESMNQNLRGKLFCIIVCVRGQNCLNQLN